MEENMNKTAAKMIEKSNDLPKIYEGIKIEGALEVNVGNNNYIYCKLTDDEAWIIPPIHSLMGDGKLNCWRHFNEPKGVLEIPSAVVHNGIAYTITRICDHAFNNCHRLRQVVVPDTVEEIEDWAFFKCTQLEHITLPEGLKSLGKYALSWCRLKELSLPELVKIGSGALIKSGLPDDWELPSRYAMRRDDLLGEKPKTKAQTPKVQVERVRATEREEEVRVERTTDRGEFPNFAGRDTYLSVPMFAEGVVVVPNTISAINDFAFENRRGVTHVVLPNTIETIGRYAFKGCESLVEIEIPSSVKYILNNAFEGCTNLRRVMMHQGLKSIDACAFKDCVSLAEVNLPRGLERIEDMAFSHCHGLRRVSGLPNTTKLGNYTFLYCESLTEVEFPESMVSLTSGLFMGCKSLKRVEIPSQLCDIRTKTFYGCSALEEVVVRDGVTRTIGDRCFQGCRSLRLVDIEQPEKCICHTSIIIGEYAFAGCWMLEDITKFPKVREMGEGAFEDCDRLQGEIVPTGRRGGRRGE